MFWYCPAAEECLLWGTVAKLEPSYRTSDDRKAFVVRRLSNDRSAFRSTRPLNAWHLTISRENCDNVLHGSLISLSSWHSLIKTEVTAHPAAVQYLPGDNTQASSWYQSEYHGINTSHCRPHDRSRTLVGRKWCTENYERLLCACDHLLTSHRPVL